jgi:membrane protein implicated in regulation of membrane protease activity
MTWATFYLVCFVVGFALSVLSALTGAGKRGSSSHLHLPHVFPHHGAAAHHGGTPGPGAGKLGKAPGPRGRASFFDFTTAMAFLSWFGGTGYLLTRYTSLWAAMVLGLASVCGLAGAGIVFLFLVRVLMAHETVLDPSDYQMVGALGRVNSSIHVNGTGEIIFSLAGTRHTCGARGEDGRAIDRGTEVVVTRYEHGIAYVRRFDELAEEAGSKPRL